MNIKEILIDIPQKPGIYMMKDDADNIIYVGKAKKLKNRVKSYFQNQNSNTIKTRALVEHVKNIEWVVTDSEHEAFALEINLIKQFMPRYNIMLKDDKHYPYIKINMKNDYPRVEVVRKVKKDGARYFGPYFDSTSMRRMLDAVNKTFKVRSCKKDITRIKGKERPCLNYDIGKCIGACSENITKQQYREIINEVIDFLSGDVDKVKQSLEEKMLEASTNMQYEKAAEIRDRLQGINKAINQGQRVISTSVETFDLFAISFNDVRAVAHVLICRAGKIIGSESFHMDMPEGGEPSEIMTYFLHNYYTHENIIPLNIYLSHELSDIEATQEYLSSIRKGAVHIHIPVKGKKMSLVNMAKENAKGELDRTRLNEQRKWERTGGAVESLKNELGLIKLPRRIEGYDISNIQGVDTVASMVVFIDGKPSRKDYRRFKIKTVEGPNDFESMAEVITRRFKRYISEREQGKTDGFASLPDLVLIDGGKGQLASARKIMSDLGVGAVETIGLAKREEEVFKSDNNIPIIISKRAPALHLLQRIRDEAHRFAITYHRSLRKKRTYKSVLDDIEGIGTKRKHSLLMAFPTISAIKNADYDALLAVKGMTRDSAQAVYDFFNSRKEQKEKI